MPTDHEVSIRKGHGAEPDHDHCRECKNLNTYLCPRCDECDGHSMFEEATNEPAQAG